MRARGITANLQRVRNVAPLLAAFLLLARAPEASAQDAGAPPAAPAPSAEEQLRQRLAGTWRHSGAGDQAALEAAVTRTVQGMGFIIEGIAAGRIRERNAIPDSVTLVFAGDAAELRVPGRPVLRAPTSGAAVHTTNYHGEPIELTARFEHGALVFASQMSQGGRRAEYSVSPDGGTLTVRITVHSPRLPRNLVYSLTYRRG